MKQIWRLPISMIFKNEYLVRLLAKRKEIDYNKKEGRTVQENVLPFFISIKGEKK